MTSFVRFTAALWSIYLGLAAPTNEGIEGMLAHLLPAAQVGELTIVERALTLGIGAFIAVVTLIWKRSDDKAYIQSVLSINERLMVILEANTKALQSLTSTVGSIAGQNVIEEQLKAIKKMLDAQGR